MCGIVGILGKAPVAEHLLDALKRLEYRGYDSAGIATLENGRLIRCRAEGKLRNLESRLTQDPLYIDSVLSNGANRARALAVETMSSVKDIVGLVRAKPH